MIIPVLSISADTVKVFILAGQSNMVGVASATGLPPLLTQPQTDVILYAYGHFDPSRTSQWLNLSPGFGADTNSFGPELNFGRTMADSTLGSGSGAKVALIKCAFGGTDLYTDWRPPSSSGTTGNRFNILIYIIQSALAALPPEYTPVIAGMLWMQGESDGANMFWSNAYDTNLTNLISDIRSQLNIPVLPFVAGMIHPSYRLPFADIVRNAETTVANKDSSVGVCETQDLPLGIDSLHYQTDEMAEIGKRFALTMLQVMNKTVQRPPWVEAGPKQTPFTTIYPATFNLTGSAFDDGSPVSPFTVTWEKVSGPGTAAFGDLNNPVTTVTLSQAGTYHLRLSASDGAITAMDAVIISPDTVVNLALAALSCTTSYCSPWESLAALNDGVEPASSTDYSFGSYSNRPQTGTQWVQYNWSTPINAKQIAVYWFHDGSDVYWFYNGRNVGLPSSCTLSYWNGTSFVPVTGASGYGVATDTWNTTAFDEVTTTALRLEFTGRGDTSTGILEWKVYGSMPGSVKQDPVGPCGNFSILLARNKLLIALPRTAGEKTIVVRIFDASGRMIKTLLQKNTRGGNYSIGLDCLSASRLYLAVVRYGGKIKTLALRRIRY